MIGDLFLSIAVAVAIFSSEIGSNRDLATATVILNPLAAAKYSSFPSNHS